MAKYSDYAKNEQTPESLETEIAEAGARTEERREEAGSALPERFRNKSAEEIAQSYIELEKFNSRQAQDLGKLRKTVDELLELQLRKPEEVDGKPQHKPVAVEDLYEDPDAAIRNVARTEVETRVKSLEQELQAERVARARAEFTKQFPTWEDDIKDPAFKNWVLEKPHRVKLAQAADSGAVDAAETLFGTYYDHKEARAKAEEKERRKTAARAASLETSGAGAPSVEETFSRTALMDKRIAAKRGDRNAQRWLQQNAESIAIAYEEGRIVD